MSGRLRIKGHVGSCHTNLCDFCTNSYNSRLNKAAVQLSVHLSYKLVRLSCDLLKWHGDRKKYEHVENPPCYWLCGIANYTTAVQDLAVALCFQLQAFAQLPYS